MTTTLTAREREILMLAYQCFKTSVQVDYEKLAELANLKNAATANVSYLAAKKKLLASGDTKLTPREKEILGLSWQCFKSSPEVDYKKLHQMAGLKNAATANVSFLAAKKKFLSPSSGAGNTAPPAKKPAEKRTKRKKAQTELTNADGTAEASVDDYYEAKKARVETEPKENVKIGLELNEKVETRHESEENAHVKQEPEDDTDESVMNLFASAAKFLEDEG